MSLTSPRLILPFAVLSLAALTIASCAEQNTPTAPSSVTTPGSVTVSTSPQSTSVQPAVTEYWVTLFDETPAPAQRMAEPEAPEDPPPGEDLPPAPAPAPPPASGSAPVPWPPGPPPLAAPGVPMPTPPSTDFRLVPIKIDPEPVSHSGTPIGIFSCRDLKYTWYYDQHLNAETSVPVTFTERENFFDGRFVSRNSETIRLVVHVPVVLHTRWCSAYAKPHYAQTRFKGKDDNGEPITISGPWVRLLTP